MPLNLITLILILKNKYLKRIESSVENISQKIMGERHFPLLH